MRTIFQVTRGEDLTLRAPLLLDGVETAIAGWTPELKVWPEAEDQLGEPLFTATLEDGLYPIEGDANAWMISVPDDVTADAEVGKYDCILRARSPSERWRVLQRFTLQFLP